MSRDGIIGAIAIASFIYYVYTELSPKQANKPKTSIWTELQVRAAPYVPLRATSSLLGRVTSYDVPVWMRSFVYGAFCRAYECEMDEAHDSDYRNYQNLSELFRRRLRPETRPISQDPGIVSPADGRVLHYGNLTNELENVKGINYSVKSFLGLPSTDYCKELLHDEKNNQLYQCIIYLAPGDYHRFHSPADWTVETRRHFPGLLLSVKPTLIERMPEILHINERVCYLGQWRHGFFSMTAVGATNVGSIKVNFDKVSNKNLTLLIIEYLHMKVLTIFSLFL